MTKQDQVLAHLKKRPITSWEAIQKYRATRLADIVFKLKIKGYNIKTEMCHPKEGRPFARYELIRGKK